MRISLTVVHRRSMNELTQLWVLLFHFAGGKRWGMKSHRPATAEFVNYADKCDDDPSIIYIESAATFLGKAGLDWGPRSELRSLPKPKSE